MSNISLFKLFVIFILISSSHILNIIVSVDWLFYYNIYCYLKHTCIMYLTLIKTVSFLFQAILVKLAKSTAWNFENQIWNEIQMPCVMTNWINIKVISNYAYSYNGFIEVEYYTGTSKKIVIQWDYPFQWSVIMILCSVWKRSVYAILYYRDSHACDHKETKYNCSCECNTL